MDEDIIENWRGGKTASQEKRANNRTESARILTEAGFSFESKNDGAHLIVYSPGDFMIDFWPGTGKWIERGTLKTARGVFPLIKHMKALS